MAVCKSKSARVTATHAFVYSLPFFSLTRNVWALLFICSSHFVIDHWKLARYVCWVKNFIAPKWIERDGEKIRNYPWNECKDTGYHSDRPAFLTVWLLIVTDNTLHVLCNGLALRYLTGL